MAEPSRTNPVEHLSNFITSDPVSVSRRGELPRSRNILQEMWSVTLRHPHWVGYDRNDGDLIRVSLPFPISFQAALDQSSRESARTIGTDVQDRAEFQCEAGLAHRRDQDVWLCLIHPKDPMTVYCLAGKIWDLTKILVEKFETNLPYAAVRLGTLADPQPLYFFDTACSPILPHALS